MNEYLKDGILIKEPFLRNGTRVFHKYLGEWGKVVGIAEIVPVLGARYIVLFDENIEYPNMFQSGNTCFYPTVVAPMEELGKV